MLFNSSTYGIYLLTCNLYSAFLTKRFIIRRAYQQINRPLSFICATLSVLIQNIALQASTFGLLLLTCPCQHQHHRYYLTPSLMFLLCILYHVPYCLLNIYLRPVTNPQLSLLFQKCSTYGECFPTRAYSRQ